MPVNFDDNTVAQFNGRLTDWVHQPELLNASRVSGVTTTRLARRTKQLQTIRCELLCRRSQAKLCGSTHDDDARRNEREQGRVDQGDGNEYFYERESSTH